MIRKWIEIVSCMMGVCWVGISIGTGGAWAAEVHRAARQHSTAQSFPVYMEPVAPARPLGLPAGVDTHHAGRASAKHAAPDIPFSYFWKPQDGLRLRAAAYVRRQAVSKNSPGLMGGWHQPYVETPETRWQPRPSGGGWSAGAVRWGTRLGDDTELTLGNSEITAPVWDETWRLSGISLTQSFLAGSDEVSQWNYALAFGAVDQSASGATDLEFGPTAGALALNYDYNSRFSMTSRTEVADDLIMSGIAGQYDLGWLGRWRSGIARSTHGLQQGWRYRAAADFDLAEDINLVWMGERYTDGFMDIRRYAGNNTSGGGRQRWSAFWDVGRWGTWSGSFESVYGRQGAEQRRFGLSQQFWYSPNLRIGIQAEREVIGDDYDIGLRFSFPLY